MPCLMSTKMRTFYNGIMCIRHMAAMRIQLH